MKRLIARAKRSRARGRDGEAGQAMLEFLLVSTMILTLIFVFVQLAWGIAYGHYVHYATYMSARALLSGGNLRSEAVLAAADSLSRYLKREGGGDLFPFIAQARTGADRDAKGPEDVPGAAIGKHSAVNGKENNRGYSWAEGVQYNWKLKLFLLPLSSAVSESGRTDTITPGSGKTRVKGIEFKGAIPFASDSFLGRDPSSEDCLKFMNEMSFKSEFGISRGDGIAFIEDNGC